MMKRKETEMKKMGSINKIDVVRLDTSSYQGEDFATIEKQLLESRLPINYQPTINEDRNHILITNSNTSTEKLNLTKKTKLIIHPNSGYDNFSIDFTKNCPCPIIIGNEIRMNAVVNYTISSLLTALSPIIPNKEWSPQRLWNRDLLEEKRILIIGQGHIGLKVNSIIKDLGGSPLVYDPYKGFNDLSFEGVEVIILCAGLNPTSERIINESALSKVSPELLLINGARGRLIDQAALTKFLKNHSKAHAFLDVFENEPFDKADFINLDNVHLTSHIAGVHNHLNSNIIEFEYKIINDFLTIENLQDFKNKYSDSLLENRIKGKYLI